MDYNIILKYTEFLKREFLNFFKIIFGDDKYPKKSFVPFIERYINVRYYDETSFDNEKDFVERINKELISIYKELETDDNKDFLKNIVALFGYIIYFDDIGVFAQEADLIDTLLNDENITIEKNDKIKKDLLRWYFNLKKNKSLFNNTIVSREFNLVEKRFNRNVIKLDLNHSIKISSLYSEYAINKAYNMETIYEQRLFITYIMASALILENARVLDFSKHYIVDFSSTLFSKSKKLKRLFNIFDNPLSKKMISIMLRYEDYLQNRELIDGYISLGYSFGVILDSKFNGDINNLVLFSYVFMSEDYELYDIIMSEKDKIKSKIIIL